MRTTQVALEGDLTVTFHLPLYLEYILDMSEFNKETQTPIIDWCEAQSVFQHQTEYEYIFPLMPDYKNFMRKMDVPSELEQVFKAALKEAEKKQDENGTVYLHIWLKE